MFIHSRRRTGWTQALECRRAEEGCWGLPSGGRQRCRGSAPVRDQIDVGCRRRATQRPPPPPSGPARCAARRAPPASARPASGGGTRTHSRFIEVDILLYTEPWALLHCCCLPAPAPASSFRSAPRLTRTVPWEDLADLLRIRLLQANICHWQHHWHVFMCKSSKKTSCSACAAVQVCTFCWRTRCAVPSDRDWLLCKYDSGSSPATNWMVASSRASRACGARFQRHQRRACVCAHARALVSQCSMLQTGHVMAQGA